MKAAIRYKGKVYARSERDTHDSLIKFFNLKGIQEENRGFTNNGRDFLSRTSAARVEKDNGRKVPTEMHSTDLMKSKGLKPVESDIDVSKLHCIVFDRGGLYTYFAQRLGESYGRVDYYSPDTSAYPESAKAKIGKGLSEIRRIDDREFYRNLRRADLIAFPDCYDGDYQHYLRSEGHTVFGSGLSEVLEIDKVRFLEKLEELNLPIAYTEICDGFDELLQYLKGKKDLWIKSLYRGDFETKHYVSMKQFLNWANQYLRPKLGGSIESTRFLVQDPIDAVCEIGYDGFRVGGQRTETCMVGYEIKDKGYVCKVFDETPSVLVGPTDAFEHEYSRLGYWGHYSNEMRITKDGVVYSIDETSRIPSPPGELMCVQFDTYPEDVYRIAKGMNPYLDYTNQFGAEIVLTSPFYEDHQICVEAPKDVLKHVALKNHFGENGAFYCVPNGNGSFFGAVRATGSTLKEAMDKCLEVAEEVECEELEYDCSVFDKANEQIESGAKFGVDFT